MAGIGERGKALETAEDVLKAIMNLTFGHVPPSPKNIILTVNQIRKKDGRRPISERSIRYAMSLLLQSGAVRKRKLTYEKILDDDDNIIGKDQTHTELYEIDREETVSRKIKLKMDKFERTLKRKNVPGELSQKMMAIRGYAIVKHADLDLNEILELEQLFYVKGHYIESPDVKKARDYYFSRVLEEIMGYLRMLHN